MPSSTASSDGPGPARRSSARPASRRSTISTVTPPPTSTRGARRLCRRSLIAGGPEPLRVPARTSRPEAARQPFPEFTESAFCRPPSPGRWTRAASAKIRPRRRSVFARAGGPRGPARRSGRAASRAGSSAKMSRNRRCLRALPRRSMTSKRASSRASAGAAATRSGGRKNSKSTVCKPAALCNPLYKTSFLDNTIPFTSPHDNPQGAFSGRHRVPGTLSV